MKPWIGKSFLIIGILHTLVGFAAFQDIVREMLHEGLFNTVILRGDAFRETAFWFLLTGFNLMIIGGLVGRIERSNARLPAFLAWSFSMITLTGILIMPLSGFWLLLVPTVGLFVRLRKNAQPGVEAKI